MDQGECLPLVQASHFQPPRQMPLPWSSSRLPFCGADVLSHQAVSRRSMPAGRPRDLDYAGADGSTSLWFSPSTLATYTGDSHGGHAPMMRQQYFPYVSQLPSAQPRLEVPGSRGRRRVQHVQPKALGERRADRKRIQQDSRQRVQQDRRQAIVPFKAAGSVAEVLADEHESAPSDSNGSGSENAPACSELEPGVGAAAEALRSLAPAFAAIAPSSGAASTLSSALAAKGRVLSYDDTAGSGGCQAPEPRLPTVQAEPRVASDADADCDADALPHATTAVASASADVSSTAASELSSSRAHRRPSVAFGYVQVLHHTALLDNSKLPSDGLAPLGLGQLDHKEWLYIDQYESMRKDARERGVGVIPVDERRASIAHLSSSDAMERIERENTELRRAQVQSVREHVLHLLSDASAEHDACAGEHDGEKLPVGTKLIRSVRSSRQKQQPVLVTPPTAVCS
mmetsp:Transcript_9640/g.21140  ORF Transcript_9640/g.21140 Transcript_9640/m.21140 type:complete len:457 (-) Transcript_9640:642-2012(-)